MHPILQELSLQIISLFVIMNPVSAGVVMLTMNEDGLSQAEIRDIAYRNSVVLFIAMTATLLLGRSVIDFFGISIHSIKVIGGTILFIMGINMVQGGAHKSMARSREEDQEARDRDDIAIIPLAIPIIYGPGLMATLIAMQGDVVGWYSLAITAASVTICILLNYFILKNMIYINRTLGVYGVKIMSRLMGLVVGALAAQFIVGGIKALWMQS